MTDNGFPHPGRLDANLAPYVADDWKMVAVKVAPAAQGGDLTGEPALISGDYVFEPAGTDTTDRQIIYRERNRGEITGLALLALIGLGGLMIIAMLTRHRDRAGHLLS